MFVGLSVFMFIGSFIYFDLIFLEGEIGLELSRDLSRLIIGY